MTYKLQKRNENHSCALVNVSIGEWELDVRLCGQEVERREAQTSRPPSEECESLLYEGHCSEVTFCLAGFFCF